LHETRIRNGGLSGQRLNQYPEEIESFLRLMRNEGVKSYLEIGCRWGDTLHAVGTGLPQGARIVGVDLPGIKTGGIAYKVQGTEPYLERAVQLLKDAGRDAHLVIGNSRAADTIERARSLGPFDMVLIDGDHTLTGVRADWENYGPMGRMVAFHDVMNGQAGWGVGDLYRDLSSVRPSKLISINDRRRGIGVVWN
jgi:predicted O-methyltransferase YrrM